MGELTTIQIVLFLIVAGELTAFLVMNGSDFGAGISTIFAKNDEQRSTILRVPGPVWFGNETWLIVAMATMFGAFPRWYASLASGFYLVFFFVLMFFIFKALAFNYRTRWNTRLPNRIMDIMLFFGSLLPPFLVAMVFTASLQGVPITNEIILASFFDIVTPFTVWSGIVMVLLCWTIGLARVVKYVEGDLKERLRKRSQIILWLLLGSLVVEVVFLLMFTGVMISDPLPTVLLLSLIVVSVLALLLAQVRRMDRLFYWVSIVPIVALMAIIFVGLYPNAINDVAGSSLSLSAASSGYTSELWVAGGSAVMLPVMIFAQIATYYFANKYYAVPDTDINY